MKINVIVILLIMLISTGFVYAAPTSVSVNYPTDGIYVIDTTPDINITVTGGNDTYSCTIYSKRFDGDYAAYGTNAAVSNNTATVLTTNATLDTVKYYSFVNCTKDTTISSSTISYFVGESNLRAMNEAGNFIQDVVRLLPTLITVIIYGCIIALVYVLVGFIGGILSKR